MDNIKQLNEEVGGCSKNRGPGGIGGFVDLAKEMQVSVNADVKESTSELARQERDDEEDVGQARLQFKLVTGGAQVQTQKGCKS